MAGSQSLTVELADGAQFPATIVKQSDDKDLALIKIDAKGLTPAVIGDSATLQVGQTVIAIGSPLGTFTETVTKGILSGDRPHDHRPGRGHRPADDPDRPAPDRRRDQPRQQRRAAARRDRARRRRQHRGLDDAEGLGFAIPISDAASLIAQATGASVS